MQPHLEGSRLAARGMHTVTLVGEQILVYGGSSDFDIETMQCQTYHKDMFTIDASKCFHILSQSEGYILE